MVFINPNRRAGQARANAHAAPATGEEQDGRSGQHDLSFVFLVPLAG